MRYKEKMRYKGLLKRMSLVLCVIFAVTMMPLMCLAENTQNGAAGADVNAAHGSAGEGGDAVAAPGNGSQPGAEDGAGAEDGIMLISGEGADGSEAAAGDGSDVNDASDKVASSSEMASPQEVGEEGMIPVYAGQIEDGIYDIEVDSSSSMFRIVEAKLNVAEGRMNVEMTMGGKGYLYVFMGTGEEAVEADESEYIAFTENEDGSHSFTVPVEALNVVTECTAFSKKKEKWYDRQLVFSADMIPEDALKNNEVLKDGEYTVEVTLSGGSGKASVESPAEIVVEDGVMTAKIVWSSPNYDYMIVGGQKIMPVEGTGNGEVNSEFVIPLAGFDFEIPVIADTVAMSEPHEIAYTLYFDSASVSGGSGLGAGFFAVIAVIFLIALIGGVFIGRRIMVNRSRQ